MARAARLARQLCGRRRRSERPAAAESLHRRRSEAEHLSLSPRRAARVRSGGRISCARRSAASPRLRSHAAATRRAVIDAINGVFAGGRRGGRVRGLSRAHAPAAPERPSDGVWRCLASPGRETNREGKRPDSHAVWRDSLLTPRLVPDEVLREQRSGARRRPLRNWLDAGDATAAETIAAGAQARVAAPRRRRLADAARAAAAGFGSDADGCGRARRTWSRCSTCWSRRHHDLSLARALKQPALRRRRRRPRRARACASARARRAGGERCRRSIGRRPRWLGPARCCAAGMRAVATLPPHDLLDRIVHEGDVHARTPPAVPPGERAAGARHHRRGAGPGPAARRRPLRRRPTPSCGRCAARRARRRCRCAPRRAPAHRARRQGPRGRHGAAARRRSREARQRLAAAHRLAGGGDRPRAVPLSTTSRRSRHRCTQTYATRGGGATARRAERALRRDDAGQAPPRVQRHRGLSASAVADVVAAARAVASTPDALPHAGCAVRWPWGRGRRRAGRRRVACVAALPP